MFKHISTLETAQLIAEQSATVVDIRDLLSFNQGHIKGAYRVDNQNIQDFITRSDLDKPLIVCCYHGHSSMPAADYFSQQGFEDVYSMDGGMAEWGLNQEIVPG